MARTPEASPIVVRCAPPDTPPDAPPLPSFTYRVAGQRVVSDGELDALRPFADHHATRDAVRDAIEMSAPGPRFDGPGPAVATRFDDRAWLGGREERLICRATDDRCWLEAVGLATVAIDLRSGTIVGLEGDPRDLIIGPALALVLAARGTYCLHASAVSVRGRVRIFIGDSGVGKSTLVAATPDGVTRLADDIVPVSAGAGRHGTGPIDIGPKVWPAYPQLKLPDSAQHAGTESLPVESIAVLERDSSSLETVEITPMTAGEATLALARHTVAAKLFPPPLLDAHLRACVGWARGMGVATVRFRPDLERIESLRSALFA